MSSESSEHRRTEREDAEASSMRAEHYLEFAVEQIDRLLGEGYAMANPGLMGAFMQAAAIDFHSHTMREYGDRLSDSIRTIERAVNDLCSQGRGVHELVKQA